MIGRGGVRLKRLSKRALRRLSDNLVTSLDRLGTLRDDAPELSEAEAAEVAHFGMDAPE